MTPPLTVSSVPTAKTSECEEPQTPLSNAIDPLAIRDHEEPLKWRIVP